MHRLATLALSLPIAFWLPVPSLHAQTQTGTLELLSPREDRASTAREFVNVLGRTLPGNTARVAGEPVTVFSTGVFARDRVPLAMGLNRITIEAVAASGAVTSRVLEIERVVPPAAVPAPPPQAGEVPSPLPPQSVAVVIGDDPAELLHGVHEVRLGGPFIADAAPGTRFLLTAELGALVRAELAPGFPAWLPKTAVQMLPAGTTLPRPVFTTFSISGHAEGDVVQIPLAAPLAYTVRARGGELEIDLYGTHLAATWISQRASARLVREATAEAAGDGRVRLRIALHHPRLWGWRVEHLPGAMRIVLRAPPVLPATGSPLVGLHVALEAGHGSADNLGAVGATGVPEKDINRWTADALAAELRAAGATVTQVREGDENPPQRERARRINASGAQVFISVHANAADTSNGFLRVSGTSTYYKQGSARDLAAAVQRRMLATSGLDDFGLVGNFNYTPLRLVTAMPSMLFEQAFVSHPGDEAKLLDPSFRALMARAVRLGLEDFLAQR